MLPVLVLLRLTHHDGIFQIVEYCALLALCGVDLAVIGSPSIVEASFVVQRYDKANSDFFEPNGPYATLYAINFMVFSAELAFGSLLSGSLRDAVVAELYLLTASLSFVYIDEKLRVLRRKGAYI